jgi:glyoxylase-like metal-dependent hydrolase (beta-lactamase superfamily II)
LKQFDIGDLKIAVINTGHLYLSMKEMESLTEMDWQKYPDVFRSNLIFQNQSILISSGSKKNTLVDAGNYSALREDDDFRSYIPPNYNPPPDLETQLETIGVDTEDIDLVVITHAHYDHYSGVTKRKGASYVPTFPNAQYFLGKADWEDERLQNVLGKKDSPDARTLGVLEDAGKLELVSGTKTLSKEVEIVPAPGESPGHQIVRVQSLGTLYCVGDLFHHEVEVENLSWMATWCEPKSNFESRKKLIELALKENALVLPSHMPLGRIITENEKAKFIPET